ncbi:MAG: homing endonuclease associated repeat-containing protein, partial [Candidatus Angelobacter sp.]
MHKRDEIIAAIKRCAERLGRAPSQAEFRRASKISWHQVYKHFRGMRQAVRAAGLEPGPRGSALDVNALTVDWARVVRKLGRLPSRAEYCEHGIHHAGTLHARIVWSQMAHKFVLLVKEFHLEREWADVVKIVVGKFPLLGELPQRTQRTTEESTAAADWRRETQIGEVGRELTRIDTNENWEPQSAQRNTEAGELECNLGPSLAVKAPLVQDDGLRRGDLAPRDLDRSGMRLG